MYYTQSLAVGGMHIRVQGSYMRVFIIKRYFKTKSYKTVCESFKEKFGDEQTLLNSTIKCIVKYFEVHLHLEDALCIGRPMVRTEKKKDQVYQQNHMLQFSM